ncbi:MAG TPA: acetyl-CoA carboxylase biotin carboxyl carrier protein subunit, partial [Ottowia sp.]|nr:acetyl-CoA carboxylase biotin carboxyl carrier protein subunit [Ottowia sp.]
ALGAGAGSAPPAASPAAATADPGDVLAPLTGSLVRWHRESGEQVDAGEVIATLEAMKMETAVSAPCAGTLECMAAPGELLQANTLLARIRASSHGG